MTNQELIENLNCFQMQNILNDDSKYLIVSVSAFYDYHRKKSITIHLENNLPSEPIAHTHCYYAEEIRNLINNMISNRDLKKIER